MLIYNFEVFLDEISVIQTAESRCSHTSRRETCRFYRFPSNDKEFNMWKKMCRRADRDPTLEDRLCSCHFQNADRTLGPTIFPWNQKGQWSLPEPEKRTRKRKEKTVPLNVEVPGPSNVEVAGPSNVGVAGPSNVEVAGPWNVSVAGPSNVSVAGPSNVRVAGSSNVEVLAPMETTPTTFVSSAVQNAEIYFLTQENMKLKEELKNRPKLSYKDISQEDNLVFKFTGLPTSTHFSILSSLISRFDLNYFDGWKVQILNPDDQLLCTLMWLRLNCLNFDLAFRFKVSTATIHNVVMTYLYALHEILYVGMMANVPSRTKNSVALPTCFREFPNCRMILDCTEIEVAIPQSLTLKKVVFSHYKQRHTFKVLVGIAPNATITFVSDLFPGSTSDKIITKESGVLHHMVAGDLILADKGFLIKDMCNELGVSVNIPPFLNNPQFTEQEILVTRKIARARIHVERAIGRLKNFKALDFIMPHDREHASVIVQTCAALVNLQYALLKESEQCFELLTD